MNKQEDIISSLQATLGKMEIALGAIQEAIVWSSEEGVIQWCNQSFDEMLGLPHILLLGADIVTILPLEKDGVTLSGVEHPYSIVREQGSLDNEVYTFVSQNEKVALEVSGSKVPLVDGKPIIILTIRNITSLQAHREELRQSKETLEFRVQERTNELLDISNKYKSIVSQAVDAIITIDTRGHILSFNPAAEKMFGYVEEEVIGRSVATLMPSPHKEMHDQYLQNYLTSGVRKVIGIGREAYGLRKTGEHFPIELTVSEVCLKKQTIFTGIVRDMSAKKAAEAALHKAKLEAEQANKAKSNFLTQMSHEMRTPLGIILGMAELLSETSLTDVQKEYIEASSGAGHHLLGIIDHLLDLSKIEAGLFQLDEIPFDLPTLLREVVGNMRVLAGQKDISLKYVPHPNLPQTVVGDQIRLRQVLINLIGNGIKFTEEGTVSLEVTPLQVNSESSASSIGLYFAVSDTGLGIPEEMLTAIFDSFTQVDPSITRKFGGAGLGLSISQNLVQKMGGDIRVLSELGVGSTFSFTIDLKLLVENLEQQRNLAPSYKELRDLSSKKPVQILLAEDSADNRILFEAFLKAINCSIDYAENGDIAWEMFRQKSYDVVLMDIQMPVLDGYSAAKLIRTWENEQQRLRTPIIALTAHGRDEDKEKSLEAGCDRHLTKPVTKKDLISAMVSVTGVSVPEKKERPNPPSQENAERILIEIDEMLEDLIPSFLENRNEDVKKLKTAVSTNDFASIERIGHMMKGSGGGYGFTRLSEIGGELEETARQERVEEIESLIVSLENYLARVDIVFTV